MKRKIEMDNIEDASVNPIETEIALLKSRIHQLLSSNKVEVNFTKADGSARKMICTLCPDLMPSDITFSEGVHVEKPDNVLAVWDLEKDDWRSFRLDRVDNFMTAKSEA